MALKAQAQFTNPYEAAYVTLHSNPYFNEEDWRNSANGADSSSLDMYIFALQKIKDLDKTKFDKTYNSEYQNSTTRLSAIYNEAFASKIANDDRFAVDVYKYDDAGNMLYDENGNPKTERKTVSEYEYNKMIINQENDVRMQEHLRRLKEEARDPSFWGDIYSFTVDLAFDGILEFFNKTAALLVTAGDIALNPNKTFEDDWFREWETNYKPVLDRFEYNGKKVSDLLVDWEVQNTHLRDVDGNFTTAGRITNGVATTAGEMMASIIISGGLTYGLSGATAGTGLTAKAATMAAKVIPTATYYAPLAVYGMGEDYKSIVANGGSISTGKMFANQLIKTGVEIAIEQGLGKVFGATGLDKALFGHATKATTKLGKVGLASGLLHFGKEAIQEGTEEFLQEFSGFLVNYAFKRMVDDDFTAELDAQSLIDAAIIGAIISAGSSSIQIASTKNKLITDADGKARKLSKIASAYYNVSMPTFFKKLADAQRELDSGISKLPGVKKEAIQKLQTTRQNIQARIDELGKKITESRTKDLSIGTNKSMMKLDFSRSVANRIGKGFALDKNNNLVNEKESHVPTTKELIAERDRLEVSLQMIESEMSTLTNMKDVETGDQSLSEFFGDKFVKLYTAARSIQAFANFIGEERITKASEILDRIEKMGNEGKFDESEIVKARDEICNELQLSGIAIDVSFRTRIGESGMTKIKRIFKRKDVKESSSTLSESDKSRLGKIVDKLFKLDNKIEHVVVSEDGKKIVSDEKTMIVPEKELEQGAALVAHDDAEQRLVEGILNYSFHGDVLDRVIKTYHALYKPDATEREAINALLFDESFFLTMLTGDEDKNVKIADMDMYQFLSSLLYIEKNIVVDNIRNGVYVNKIKSVKEHMTKALTYYLKVQPFADYELDILSKAQHDEIRMVREGFAVYNRIVSGKSTDSDRNFIYAKINSSPLSKAEKDAIGNKIDKGTQLEKRDALIKLDEAYRIAFYGSYDGKTYLPTNSIRNQAVNQLLYSQGLTIGNMLSVELHPEVVKTIEKLYGKVDIDSRIKFLSNRLSMMTMGRYSIEVIKNAKVDPENGVFEGNGVILRVVDKTSTFETSNLETVQNVKNKTHIAPASRHSQMVVKLLNDTAKSKGAGYYTINDVIMNPTLLKDSVRKNIQKEYLEVTPDTTYKYLKSYYAKTEKINITLASDGRVIFVDVTPVKDILSDDFSVQKVKSVVAGQISVAELVNVRYRVPLMDECELVFADSPEFYVETLGSGKNRGIKRAVIRLSKSSMNDVEALKTEFAHELQHLVQEVTKLNTGTSGNVLSLFDKDTANKIREVVMKKVPYLFRNVDSKNKSQVDAIVNKFLYYGSGEYAAYGAETSGIAKLYPTLIQERGDRVVITLPWGDTFTSETKGSKQMLDEEFEKFYNETMDFISEGDKNVKQVIDNFNALCDRSDIKSLASKVFKNIGDVKIKFISQNEITEIAGKNAAGILINGVIYYNSTYLNQLFEHGELEFMAEVILHEFVHLKTVDAVKSVEAKLKGKKASDIVNSLSEREKGALTLIQLYKGLKLRDSVNDSKVNIYAMTDVYEFIAELSSHEFRTYLKKQSLWDKILNAIKSILGLTGNVYDVAVKALDTVLEAGVKLDDGDVEGIYFKEVEKIDHNKHLRSKGRTPRKRVGKRASKGTPLEPFAGRRISLPLQELILKSANEEYQGIDKEILAKIKDGTLTTSDLYEFLREAEADDETAERTFKLINDTVFHNQYITSLKELDEYVIVRTPNYYALRAFIRSLGKGDQLAEIEDPKLYERALNLFMDDPVAKREITNISNRYFAGPVINEKNLRRLWMQYFDGSIESGGYVAAVARVAAYQGWVITGGSAGSSSINMNVGKGKDKSSTLKREDVIPSKEDFDDFNRFITDEKEDLLVAAMDRELINTLIQRKQSGENITWDVIDRERFELKERVAAIRADSPAEFMELYGKYVSADEVAAQALFLQSLAREVSGNKTSNVNEVLDELDKAEEQAKGILRPKSYVIANIKSIARTIRGNLNRAQRNRFLKDNQDLFDDNLKIKTSLYQNVNPSNGVIRLKDESILLEIEERVRQLSKDVRAGVYSTDESRRYKIATDKRIRRLETKLAKALTDNTKEKIVYVRVGTSEMSLETDVEVPLTVKRFLENSVKMHMTEGSIAKTEVKNLSEKDDVHIKMSCEEFFSLNAETLNHLTQDDVNAIVDFYCSTAAITRNPVYSSIELYTLGYFIKMSGKEGSNFTLSDERLNQIENLLEFVAHDAGTKLSVWKSVEKMLRPEETIHKAMLKICGIELSPRTEGDLIMAINSHDIKRIQAAKQKAFEEAVSRYGSRKRTIFERLLRWEQMAMLSGPGTWVRNLTSNVLVIGANSLADVLGRMLPESKNHKKFNQYRIMGTRIGDGYAQWVKVAVMDSGLIDLFSDGLVKYDPRQATKNGIENQLTKLIIDKIGADLFNYSEMSNKIDKVNQKINNLLRIVMSDKWAINKAFEKYLGKMLTEDHADISGDLTPELMNTIADAYVMALHDYMHKSSCFSKIESSLKTYLYKHFNPTAADGIFFMYKQVFPFANASWNWFVESLNYTPLGLAMGIRNFCKLENTVNAMESARQKGETVRSARFAEYLAKRKIVKGSIGTVGFVVGIILTAVGLVGVEDNDDEYKLCFTTNDGPIYIDFSDLFGTSGILWGMSFAQGFKDADGFNYDSMMKMLTSSLNTMFLDSTLADMFNTFRYSESFGDFLLSQPGQILGMFFPNFIRTLANTSRKYKNNYAPGFLGKLEKFAIQSFAPFSYLAPYQINPYTGDAEVVNEGWFGVNLINAFSPIKVKNYNFGDAEMTAVSLGVKKGQLSGRYDVNGSKLSLTGEQVTNLNQYYGKLNQKDLQDFLSNKTKYSVELSDGTRKELTYSKMTEAQKKAVIERIMSNNGQLAKVYILTSSAGYKYYASDSEYDKLKDAGIITNVYRKQGKYDGFVKN